jgi:histone deacetylase 1/2
LQEPDVAEAASDTESDSNFDSGDEDTRRRRSRRFTERWRKRMSIVSNDWFEVPSLDHFGCGHGHNGDPNETSRKRKTFCSGLSWNLNNQAIVVQKEFALTASEGVLRSGGSRAESVPGHMGGSAGEGGRARGVHVGRSYGADRMYVDEEEE